MANKGTSIVLMKADNALTPNDFKIQGNAIKDMLKSVMKRDKDYGLLPGTQNMSLLKPGAEKLARMFGLTIDFEIVKEVEDWEAGFFFYKVKAILKKFSTGEYVGSVIKSCNSREKKYLFITEWVNNQKTKRKRSPEETADIANTILSMAEKRAAVAVVYQVTGASDIFEPEQEVETERSAEDESRHIVMAKLFAAGSERGFTTDQIKNSIYKMFDVDSVTETSIEQMEAFIEKLYTTYAIVKSGGSPKKLNADIEVEETPEEGEVVDTEEAKAAEKVFSGETEEKEQPEQLAEGMKECYQCKTKFDPNSKRDTDSPYYCTKKCQDEYYAKSNPPKKDFKFNKSTPAQHEE